MDVIRRSYCTPYSSAACNARLRWRQQLSYVRLVTRGASTAISVISSLPVLVREQISRLCTSFDAIPFMGVTFHFWYSFIPFDLRPRWNLCFTSVWCINTFEFLLSNIFSSILDSNISKCPSGRAQHTAPQKRKRAWKEKRRGRQSVVPVARLGTVVG
jgi:hypothetical protein